MSDTEAPSLERGALLAPGYEVVRLFDRAHNHEVYDVWSRQRRCRCMAKTMSGPPYSGPAVESLVQEGRLLARFTHPHIVRAYETIRDPRPIVILETLTGETLSHALDRLDRLTFADVALLGQQLCAAMAYLHVHDWLHLDLKPSNLVCEEGRVRVLDLSVALRPGSFRVGVGTAGYMSPEQIEGKPLSAAADVWGIGMVMFEAATGSLPFEDPLEDDSDASGEDETDDSYIDEPEPIEGPAPSLGTRRQTPEALIEAVDRCLELDPHRRPTLDDLSASLAGISGVDPKTSGALDL